MNANESVTQLWLQDLIELPIRGFSYQAKNSLSTSWLNPIRSGPMHWIAGIPNSRGFGICSASPEERILRPESYRLEPGSIALPGTAHDERADSEIVSCQYVVRYLSGDDCSHRSNCGAHNSISWNQYDI